MFGFLFGTLCLMGLFALKMGAYGHHRHRHHHRSRRRGGPRGGRRQWWARAGGEMLKRRLDLDEDQGDIADHAMADVRRSVRELTDSLRDSRAELADVVREATFDDARLEVVFDRLDEELKRTRREVVSAVKQVHAVLEDDQREQAASWLAGARWV